MSTQQSVYILGIVNLILAGVAIFCVAQAEDDPEYFSLVYIAVIIFIFYMGTILIIIILQIHETYQEERKQNQSSLIFQTSLLTTQIPPQLNPTINESISITVEPNIHLSCSPTLPLTLPSFNPHHTLSTATSST